MTYWLTIMTNRVKMLQNETLYSEFVENVYILVDRLIEHATDIVNVTHWMKMYQTRLQYA